MLLEGKSVAIIITMLVMGILLGFVGAGGAGFIIAILTLVFHIPIHVGNDGHQGRRHPCCHYWL